MRKIRQLIMIALLPIATLVMTSAAPAAHKRPWPVRQATTSRFRLAAHKLNRKAQPHHV